MLGRVWSALSMVEVGGSKRILVGALLLLVGCRALGGTSTDDAGASVDAGADVDVVEASDASTEFPTRLEPPIVTPAENVVVETLAGSSTKGGVDGEGAGAQFDNPVGVFLDGAGGLLVTEYDGRRLRRISNNGSTTTLVSGLLEPFALVATDDAIYVQTDRAPGGAKGPTTGSLWRVPLEGGVPEIYLDSIGLPRGLARLLDGRIVISDREGHRITILDPATKNVIPLAGSGMPGLADGRGTAAQFNEPYGLAVLPDGSIVVADARNNVIRKVTLEGDVTVFAGEGNPGMRDHVNKLLARFDYPKDVAADAAGNVFVTDPRNQRIRRITSEGAVDTIAGDGTAGFADGSGPTAKFYGQEQIDVSPDGKTVYVSDGNGGDGTSFHRIRKITLP